MKWKIFLTAGIIIVVAIILVITFSKSSKPSSFDVKDGQLSISGAFGTNVALDEIEGLQLTELPPEVKTRTNGSGLGTKLKGEFLLKDDIKARLYIDTSKPPFIAFTAGGTVFYIGLDTKEATEALYQQLVNDIG
jgi:hypothetical protein